MRTLPPDWSEARDATGRIYYVNHTSKITTWERPVPNSSGNPPPPAHVEPAVQVLKPPCVCTPKLGFWIVAGLSWIVWTFAVGAASDDKWLEVEEADNVTFAAGSDSWLDMCDEYTDYFYDDDNPIEEQLERFCELYKTFTAMQFIATILCSFAVVLLSVAFFRPATTGRVSARTLAMTGGAFLGLYSAFQMIAFILIIVIGKEELWDSYGVEADEGDTFAVGVVGCFFGIVATFSLFFFLPYSGDGPCFQCVRNCMAAGQPKGPPPTAVANGSVPTAPSQPPGPADAANAVVSRLEAGAQPPPYNSADAPPPTATL